MTQEKTHFSKEVSKNIKSYLTENKFKPIFSLMREIKDLNSLSNLLASQYNHLIDEKNLGIIKENEYTVRINRIRKVILNTIENNKPKTKEEKHKKYNEVDQNIIKFIEHKRSKISSNRTLIGREKELEEYLRKRDKQGGHRILIAGVGGIGKTDFCKRILRDSLDEKPEQNIYWVELQGLSNKAALKAAFLKFFNLPDKMSDEKLIEEFKEHSGLYYLDNLESILSDEDSTFFLEKLTEVPQTWWLASSRSTERLSDWTGIKLKGLSIEAAEELFLSQWHEYSISNKTKTDNKLKDFIKNQLGYHPLSIILTASHRNRLGKIESVIEEWNKMDKDIIIKLDGNPLRKNDSLHTSIEFSLDAIKNSKGAVSLWNLMVFYPEGLPKDAQKYWIEKEIYTKQDQELLIRHSLLNNDGDDLIMLPPLIRFARINFLTDKVFLEENKEYIKKLTEYGQQYIWDFNSTRNPNQVEKSDFPFQYLTHYSKYKILHRFISLEDLTDLMESVWQGIVNEPLKDKVLLENLLKYKDDFIDKRKLAKIYLLLAYLENGIGEYSLAYSFCREAINLYKTKKDVEGIGDCKLFMGHLKLQSGENGKAEKYYLEALDIYEQGKNIAKVADCQLGLGQIKQRMGHISESQEYFENAYRNYPENANLAQAEYLFNIGMLKLDINKYAEAKKYIKDALEIYNIEGSKVGIANCKMFFGDLNFLLGNNKIARDYYSEALKEFEKISDLIGISSCMLYLGILEFRIGNTDKARKYYKEGEKCAKKNVAKQTIANSLVLRGELESHLGNYKKAETDYENAYQLYTEIEHPRGKGNCKLYLGRLAFRLGDYKKAKKYYEEAERYFGNKFKYSLAHCLNSLGSIELYEKNYNKARKYYKKSIKLSEKLKDLEGLAICELNIGRLEFKLENLGEAKRHFENSLEYCERINYQAGKGLYFLYHAELLESEQNFSRGRENLKKGLEIAKKTKFKWLEDKIEEKMKTNLQQ